MNKEICIKESSDNIFADIGLENAEELDLKAELIFKIESIMKKRGLSQNKTAEIIGADQSTLSKVIRGRLNLVSTDRLVRWLKSLGFGVELTLYELKDVCPPVTVTIPVPDKPARVRKTKPTARKVMLAKAS